MRWIDWQKRSPRVLPFIDREVLVFCIENQSIWSTGVRLGDLSRADPPVFAWMFQAFSRFPKPLRQFAQFGRVQVGNDPVIHAGF